jgi:hypothetical protein
MTDSMLPIIRQLHDADGDQARARVLLSMPDSVLLKYAGTIGDACRNARFDAGAEYVLRRVVIMRAVRGADGLLPRPIAADFDDFRTALAMFAVGRVEV